MINEVTDPTASPARGHRHETLGSAPLVQAGFELRARASTSLSLLPGRLAESLIKSHPRVTETEAAKFAGITEMPAESPMLITHVYMGPDDQQLVHLGTNGIGVNSLAYPGFEGFKETIETVIGEYLRLTNPKSVERIALRYINGFPASSPLLAPLTLKVDWPRPSNDDGDLQSLAARSIWSFVKPPGKLSIAVRAPHRLGTLVDVEFAWKARQPLPLESVLEWADQAHDRVYDAFKTMSSPALFESWRETEKGATSHG